MYNQFNVGREFAAIRSYSSSHEQRVADDSHAETSEGGLQYDSIYSCDSILDETNEADYDNDDEPYDDRIRNYLEENAGKLKLRLLDPLQRYTELKIANVLSKGTLSEGKIKRKLKAVRNKLPQHKIVTREYKEAVEILNDVESYINKSTKLKNIETIYEMIMKLVADYFKPENLEIVPDSDFDELTGGGSKPLQEIWKATMDLVSSSSDEAPELGDDESSGDESLRFKSLSGIKFLFPTKLERRLYTPEFLVKSNDKLSERSSLRQSRRSKVWDIKKSDRQKFLNSKKAINEESCTNVSSPEDVKISKKRLIILFKEELYRTLRHLVLALESNESLMKNKIFRIWNNRQKDGVAILAADILRRKKRLELRIQRALKLRKVHKSTAEEVDNEKSTIRPEMYGSKNRRWRRTADCIREREKILNDKRDKNFLSGVLGNKATIKTERNLGKKWPIVPKIIGLPPAPPRTNERILTIINNFLNDEHSNVTYGDILRLSEGDASYVMEDKLGPMEGDKKISCEISSIKYEASNPDSRHPKCREWNDYILQDVDIESPYLTKRELNNYIKMLNDKFFPDPNFKITHKCVDVDENAILSSNPQLLKMNYSLEDLENDIYRANGMKCSHSRAVYFFQYKREYSAVDLQAAYEQYVHQNVEDKNHEHPTGCLLIYKNVNLAIVMIEGQVDHLYYHFSDFRNSILHRFIVIGRILYYSEREFSLLNHWISIVADPHPGKIRYMNNSKKVLHRVAEPRMSHLKRKLHDLYCYMASIVNTTGKNQYDRIDSIPASMKTQIHPCPCQSSKRDSRSEDNVSPSDLINLSKVIEKGESDSREQANYTAEDLLPSPASVAYLLKYRHLLTIDGFLDQMTMQPVFGSDDEKFNVIEDVVLSNYVDSEDEQDKVRLIREIKRKCKERDIIAGCQEGLMDGFEAKEAPWAKTYDLSMFTPKLKQVQVRRTGDHFCGTIDVDHLIDSNDESVKVDGEEQYLQWSQENENLGARRNFINFVETGSEAWQKKVKRFGLTGVQVKEILRDARRYKDLRKVLELQEKLKAAEEEVSGESAGVEDSEKRGEATPESKDSRASLLADTMDELEALLNELGEDTRLGEDQMWPRLSMYGRLGEYPERFGEGRIPFEQQLIFFEWDGENPAMEHQTPPTTKKYEQDKAKSRSGESLSDPTHVVGDGEEIYPEAPPATSVTDSSTDP